MLQTLVELAARLCDADKVPLPGKKARCSIVRKPSDLAEFLDYVRSIPVVPDRGSAQGRALLEGKVVQIADVQADPEYTFVARPREEFDDFRTVLALRCCAEAFTMAFSGTTRLHEVRPYTDSKLNWFQHLPTRQLSRSRTSDYSTHCACAPMNSAGRSASCGRLARYRRQ